MRRRSLLLSPLPLLAALPAAGALQPQRLATAWRSGDGDRAGILEVDWAGGRIAIAAELALPGRAHGLLPLPDGGFVIVANRPGRWLLRVGADGRAVTEWQAPPDSRTFNGHAELGPDGRRLFTTETDPATGRGWVGVRRLDTLALEGAFDSHGIDPHQMLHPGDGTLWLANGGIPRDGLGRKRGGERMAPTLVRLAVDSGRLLGQWTLPDPFLSIRHLAMASGSEPLLGVALQAEHDNAAERAAAPVLAVCDGERLLLPVRDAAANASAGGYAGDISAGPGGGFVVSAQKQGRALWWHPGDPERFTLVAAVTEPCGLVAWSDAGLGTQGTQISAGRGLALWHTREQPRMLAWPVPLAPDNHIVRLA